MLTAILSVIFGAILVFASAYIAKEILSRRNMKFYTDQGVVGDYVPITGALKYVHAQPTPGKSPFQFFFDYFKKHETNPHGMVVTNTFYST